MKLKAAGESGWSALKATSWNVNKIRAGVRVLLHIRMATEKIIKMGVDVGSAALTMDIGKLVQTLVDLGLKVKSNKEKCDELIDHVKQAAALIKRFELNKKHKVEYNEKDYRKSLKKLKVVLLDCVACVKRYLQKNGVIRVLLVLNFEADFDSLHTRLDQATKWFDLSLQVHQVGLLDENRSRMKELSADAEETRIQLLAGLEEVKALIKDNMNPDATHELSTRVEVTGESYNEGFLLAGRLDESSDIILVPTESGKKEASILYRLSNHDNILRFYGTFLRGHNDNYLVMEKPGQELQTISDWINVEANGGEWRLKTMMALETALGVAFAHKACILHKNLRSRNVFLTNDGHPKIFGFFKGRVKSEISEKKFPSDNQLRWTAPEMLQSRRPQFDEKCDIFSLGVIMWQLITGGSPFSEFHENKDMLAARRAKKVRLQFAASDSDVPFLAAFEQISLDCMEDDPQQRPSIDNVVSRLEVLTPEDMCDPSGGEPASHLS